MSNLPSPPPGPSMEIWLLGDFRVTAAGRAAEIKTARMQSLLAYLLLRRGVPQQRSHLAFTLWPDSSEAQARTNLRNLLHVSLTPK